MAQCPVNNMTETTNSSQIITSSNWKIDNKKTFEDCISSASLFEVPDSINLEDVVSLESCLSLKPDPLLGEPCKIDFKLNDTQKIVRIALVSEASVLEFFKQSGEYATTIFAEFVDEFQDQSVYFAEAKIEPPSTEASIKFTRTNNKGESMWIYGIKLILTQSSEKSGGSFNFDIINSFFDNADKEKSNKVDMAKKFIECYNSEPGSGEDINSCFQKLALNFNFPRLKPECKELPYVNGQVKSNNSEDFTIKHNSDLKTYIDDKFCTLEKRLMERIDLLEQKTTEKLDEILKKIECNS